MAGAVGAAASGAMEAGERGGGQLQADSAGAQGVVWGHAAFPKGNAVGGVGPRWVYQPPYFSEFNPAERVSKEVGRWVEGRRYESIEVKKAAVEGGYDG